MSGAACRAGRSALAALFLAMLVVACAQGAIGSLDSGVGDASPGPDELSTDARTETRSDSGIDAGGKDAGRPDARPPDAAPVDAAPPDAAPPDAPPPPRLIGIGPEAVSVLELGGTAILSVALDNPAPPEGVIVSLRSLAPAILAVPTSVRVRPGDTAGAFRVRGDGLSAEPVGVTASLPSGDKTLLVGIVSSAGPPLVGDLIINEVFYDVPVSGGDANCDGTTSDDDDEFVEIVSRAKNPVRLDGLSLWDEAAWSSGAPRFTFPSGAVLGPGEAILVYGGPTGTTRTKPWCSGSDGKHVGDAVALSASSLGLSNSGDTVRLTLGSAKTSAVLETVSFAAGEDQSITRSPDMSGDFTVHGSAPGHAIDRKWTPGTLLSGANFSAASPD